MLERNLRPNKNDLLLLTVDGNRVVRRQVLPTFDNPACDVDGDGRVEYAGIRDYAEAVDDPAKMSYNPILFYELRSTGWMLDSTATMQINKMLWGKFYGFQPKPNLQLQIPKGYNKYLPVIE
ncbi:hypothetical protein [Hymenobacter latericus]|uniref:hypothetical protein n=1 Tax=Hymenobacter sp. YIM 151858-1 TaxID=2987688 RepID=UPI002227A8E7|nr:hypothetical protein [Hymenobacter sp. YIM 151858-1]UYZ57537.1 hypothetical protein OIS50_10695 [Hymenobacter sp. YIM 151858-1]